MDEQIKISNELDGKIKVINDLISLKKNKIELIECYKKEFIEEYVFGKKEAI